MKDIIVAFTLAAGMLWVSYDNMNTTDQKPTDRYEQTQPITPKLTR